MHKPTDKTVEMVEAALMNEWSGIPALVAYLATVGRNERRAACAYAETRMADIAEEFGDCSDMYGAAYTVWESVGSAL